ncbi:MAG: FAD:protein FMN transferase [Pseudohongiellaceae bacterium]
MKELLKRHSFSASFLLLFIGFVFYFGGAGEEIKQLNGFTMGTNYQLQIVDMPEAISAQDLAAEIAELLTLLDTQTFSTYAANSELSRFNRHPVDVPFIASARMIEVLLLAQEISALSGGAFDVTVGPLVNLWGFGPDLAVFETVPTELQINSAKNRVGFQFLRISPSNQQIRKTRDVYVDLSAIAKGYAVDQLAEYLDAAGVANYFLEIGGELKIKGTKPDGAGWVPAIEAPLDTASQVYQIFYSRGDTIAVAGSGDYRNYFEEAGQRYSHEIDPRTGRPVTHRLAAAYVIDSSAARADALATTYMVLGPQAAEVLAARQGQPVYFIYKSEGEGFEDYVSDEFKYYLSDDEALD